MLRGSLYATTYAAFSVDHCYASDCRRLRPDQRRKSTIVVRLVGDLAQKIKSTRLGQGNIGVIEIKISLKGVCWEPLAGSTIPQAVYKEGILFAIDGDVFDLWPAPGTSIFKGAR